MEETWELAVVSAIKTDFSSKHTRLRYQTVLTALILFFTYEYGVEKLKIPGVLTFGDTPDESVIIYGVWAFYAFSLISLILLTIDERSEHPVYFDLYKDRLLRIRAFYQRLQPDGSGNLENAVTRLNRAAEQFDECKSEDDCLVSIAKAKNSSHSTILALKYHLNDLTRSNEELSVVFPGSESGWAETVRTTVNLAESAEAYHEYFSSSYGSLDGREAASIKNRIKSSIEDFAQSIEKVSDDQVKRVGELIFKIKRKRLVRFFHKDCLSVVLPIIVSLCFAFLTFFKGPGAPSSQKKLSDSEACVVSAQQPIIANSIVSEDLSEMLLTLQVKCSVSGVIFNDQ